MSSTRIDGVSPTGISSDPIAPVSLPDGPYEGLASGSFDPILLTEKQGGAMTMAIIQCEFYRSARAPTPKDEDVWRLVFDCGTKRLTVRHEWDTSGHSGVDEFDLDEFLAQEGAPQTALIDELFRPVLVCA
jgi:hypothetical protein